MKGEILSHQQELWVKAMAKHVAGPTPIFTGPQTTPQVLYWKSPDTIVYGMTFVILGRTLFVDGDCGCACYRWSQELSWGFLAGCDYSYFFEKCDAAEDGARPEEWDASKAEDRVRKMFEDKDSFSEPLTEDEEVTLDEEMPSILNSTSSEEEWKFALDNLDEAIRDKVFGSDYYEYYGIGFAPSPQTWLHWKGLMLALKQLNFKTADEMVPG